MLEHPFYERWSAGELTEQELARYVDEYRHAVVALAETSELLAAEAPSEHRPGLERHAAEERAHVALWDQFARAAWAKAAKAGERAGTGERAAAAGERAGAAAVGERAGALSGEGTPDAVGTCQTEACARAWTAGADTLERLAVLYAIEAGQPEISKTKLEGLTEHYGYAPEGPAVEYFTLHERLDVEHSRQAADLIERLLEDCEDREDREAACERMVARASAALKGNWELLSGVEQAARRPVSPTPA